MYVDVMISMKKSQDAKTMWLALLEVFGSTAAGIHDNDTLNTTNLQQDIGYQATEYFDDLIKTTESKYLAGMVSMILKFAICP